MKSAQEIVLSVVLPIAITPLAFLLMPFIVIAGVFRALVTWIKGLSGVRAHHVTHA